MRQANTIFLIKRKRYHRDQFKTRIKRVIKAKKISLVNRLALMYKTI